MSTDVVARLAAANPVPTGKPLKLPERVRVPRRRLAVAAALAAAVAIPAVAFAGELVDALGISNQGTSVPTSAVLPGQSQLDQALQDMQVGSTMQALGTVNGVAIYAARNADGHICLAIDHVAETYEKGVLCDLNDPGFPSAGDDVLTFPGQLQGIAADGVATVAFLDANGDVLDSTPVTNNLFASSTRIGMGVAAYVEALDANGDVVAKQPTPPASSLTPAPPSGS
ncbi:MAG TPA: hypothetical protein VJQ85_11760 [Gaiellaceae bacterium]|nr:hypothetical protein [Gaiellaceae bacterium]